MNNDRHKASNRLPPARLREREKAKVSLRRLIDVYKHYLNAYSQLNPRKYRTATKKNPDKR